MRDAFVVRFFQYNVNLCGEVVVFKLVHQILALLPFKFPSRHIKATRAVTLHIRGPMIRVQLSPLLCSPFFAATPTPTRLLFSCKFHFHFHATSRDTRIVAPALPFPLFFFRFSRLPAIGERSEESSYIHHSSIQPTNFQPPDSTGLVRCVLHYCVAPQFHTKYPHHT
jgi:hypothetical protein